MAFQTQYSQFKYQVILFRPFNAPANFQSYINKVLAEKLNIFVIFYLDNIFIYTKDLGQPHVNAIWWFFKEFSKNGFFANIKKCRFYKDKIQFLGYIILA